MNRSIQKVLSTILSSRKAVSLIMLVSVITASVYMFSLKPYQPSGFDSTYNHYNNYIIFTHSFDHLTQQQNLYQPYLQEYFDVYKYSPTFALFFGVFSLMPDWLGLILWNVLNALVLVIAIYALPDLTDKQKGAILLFSLIELLTSVQNSQSNALVAGLLIFSFVMLERKQLLIASLCIVITLYIKLFGILAVVLFLFYPGKWKAILYTLLWIVVLGLAPLMVVTPGSYLTLLQHWQDVLGMDHTRSLGLSVMNMIKTWFGLTPNRILSAGAGLILFAIPLIRRKLYPVYTFRLWILASLLIWMVIFNHKAESPTFIIAITGVAIWFFSGKKTLPDTLLIILAFVLTSLSPTDLFPGYVREEWVIPYVLKAVPCILIWIKIWIDLLTLKKPSY